MYYDFEYLQRINDIIKENPELLFEKLNLDFEIKNNKVNTCCPFHCGDNNHALYINLDKGYWKCLTHSCEKIFKGTLIGLARAALSNQLLNWRSENDKICDWRDTINFIRSLYSIDGYIPPSEEEKSN